MPRFDVCALAHFKLPLPPLSHQKELAEEISHYDAVLTATREIIRNLENLRAAAGSLAMAKVMEI